MALTRRRRRRPQQPEGISMELDEDEVCFVLLLTYQLINAN